MMQRWRLYCKAVLLGGLISLMAGCSVFPKPDPQARYTLPPVTLQAQCPDSARCFVCRRASSQSVDQQ